MNTPQTLAQKIHALNTEELARVAASLLQGRPLPVEEAADRLFHDLVSFPAIERRLDLLPLPDAAAALRQAALSGGCLPLRHLDGRLAGEPQALRDLLEHYFLGTVGMPDWRPLPVLPPAEPFLMVFPEVAISFLRNDPPELPRLFALPRPAESFSEAVDRLLVEIPGDASAGSLPGERPDLAVQVRRLLVRPPGPSSHPEDDIRCLAAVLSGERALERLALVEHRPFRPWNVLSDRERCGRLFLHLLASTRGDALWERFARRLVLVVRSLETDRWYHPRTLEHLVVLEELREEIEIGQGRTRADSGPGSGLAAEPPWGTLPDLLRGLEDAFHSALSYSGILETAVSGGRTVAERITGDGMAALAHRIDWAAWARLRTFLEHPASYGQARHAADSTPSPAATDEPYLTLPPGRSAELRFPRFEQDLRRLLLAIVANPFSPTRRGKPARYQIRRVRKVFGWPEDYTEFLFEFAMSQELLGLHPVSGDFTPSAVAPDFLDRDAAARARAAAACFWQASFDEGPISENLRELKHLFAREFLGRAGPCQFARIDLFWDWLQEEPVQQRLAQHWRRYVDDDAEVLLSISLWMARTLAWLGLAEASPDALRPDLLRLSQAGRLGLLQHRFEFPAASPLETGRSLEFGCDGLIVASLELPFEAQADLCRFTHALSLEGPLRFRLDEDKLAEAARQGEDPACLARLLESCAPPDPRFLEPVRRVLAKLDAIEVRPASGYLRFRDPETARRVHDLPALKPFIEASWDGGLILRPRTSLQQVLQVLHEHGFLARTALEAEK
ncbi:MAG: hypothetical protein HYU36_05105 [Planctomycetes bacterium]|nr:hypothetical protein [Planctomycetota bacterium]